MTKLPASLLLPFILILGHYAVMACWIHSRSVNSKCKSEVTVAFRPFKAIASGRITLEVKVRWSHANRSLETIAPCFSEFFVQKTTRKIIHQNKTHNNVEIEYENLNSVTPQRKGDSDPTETEISFDWSGSHGSNPWNRDTYHDRCSINRCYIFCDRIIALLWVVSELWAVAIRPDLYHL